MNATLWSRPCTDVLNINSNLGMHEDAAIKGRFIRPCGFRYGFWGRWWVYACLRASTAALIEGIQTRGHPPAPLYPALEKVEAAALAKAGGDSCRLYLWRSQRVKMCLMSTPSGNLVPKSMFPLLFASWAANRGAPASFYLEIMKVADNSWHLRKNIWPFTKPLRSTLVCC